MSGFTFNGAHSKSKYIKAIKSDRVLVAGRKHSTITVPASDEVILIPDKTRSPFTLPLSCLVDIPQGISIFEVGRIWDTWLGTDNWSQLFFDDDPGYYYEAICMTQINASDFRDKTKSEVIIEFYCKPTMKVVGT
ncbi:distal tail protein Dit [Lysinibacillus sp. KU-BSD001]|uniref:distal tail protein Dit n=1 Tax=Lysinibacillus sp. KU-BSD001 TaxID=3141328 RepID=UPI0036E4F077